MDFGDLKSSKGLEKLNQFLADYSYISGYTASDADRKVYGQLSSPPGTSLPHALRWYSHISTLDGRSLPAAVTTNHAQQKPAPADDDDDDIDLFGSDDEEEDAERERIKAQRLADYEARKAKKPGPIAKSTVLFDVKPWDDETDMEKLTDRVRTIQMDGLVWGASKLQPMAFGINKLQIVCVIEDAKVSVDDISEKIEGFEDFVQSVDIASFNKV